MVDTGRWLYNHIEGKPERARLRDHGVLKSSGRVALTVRFPVKVIDGALIVQPFESPEEIRSIGNNVPSPPATPKP
jgi:hypothetical protein